MFNTNDGEPILFHHDLAKSWSEKGTWNGAAISRSRRSCPFANAATGFHQDTAFAIREARLALLVNLAEDVIDLLVEIVLLR